MSPNSTIGDLIATALRQYAKEEWRLALPTTDPADFDLHYSQFSLESKPSLAGFNYELKKRKLNRAGMGIYHTRPVPFNFLNGTGMRFVLNKRGGVGKGAIHPEPAPLLFLLLTASNLTLKELP